MTRDEALHFFDEHWSDHDAMYNFLIKVYDEFEFNISILENKISSNNNMKEENQEIKKLQDEVTKLKSMLLECQDSLDEERHKV